MYKEKPTIQCPCTISISEKKTVQYDFGLLGIKLILVCDNCLKKKPFSNCILEVRDKKIE